MHRLTRANLPQEVQCCVNKVQAEHVPARPKHMKTVQDSLAGHLPATLLWPNLGQSLRQYAAKMHFAVRSLSRSELH